MADNLTDLDKGGTNCQFVNVYLGPTVGWVRVPVVPELLVTAAGAYTVPAYASRVLLKAAVTPITLPKVSTWIAAQFQANQSSFDRSLWIKDLTGNVSFASPAVLTPNGTDKIDGQASWNIINPYDLVRLYPLTDLSGWYVG